MPADTRLRATLANLLGIHFDQVMIVTWIYGNEPVVSVPGECRERLVRIGINVTEGR